MYICGKLTKERSIMKRLFLTLILIFGLLDGYSRNVININKNWRFSQENDIAYTSTVVNLPHTYNIDALSGKRDYYRGMANYVKDLYIPAEWSGQRVFIKFYGANSQANLFVNGRYVGEHQGGYTAFVFEITKTLRFGRENNLLVSVSNTRQLDFMPLVSDQICYGGLYRDVELIVVPRNHISVNDYGANGVYVVQENVSAERAELRTVVKITSKRGEDIVAKAEVIDQKGDIITSVLSPKISIDENGTGTTQIPIVIQNPILWNGVRSPYMYRVKVSLTTDDQVIDTLTTEIGIRYFAIDPSSGFSLNGINYPIKGVTRTEDYAGIGSALRPSHNQTDMELMMEMGANAVRMRESPQNQDFFKQCNKQGFLVWCDLPFVRPMKSATIGYIDKPFFKDNGKQQLIEMVRQNYNHPSVVFWGLFSNLSLRGDNPLDYIKELNDLCHNEDPTRFTAASSSHDGAINFVTDVIGWNQYFGWDTNFVSDLDVWLDQLSNKWKSLKSGLSEYGAEGNMSQWQYKIARPDNRDADHPQNYQLFIHENYLNSLSTHNFLWGNFVCSMFDYGSASREHGSSRGVNERGLVTFDRQTKKDVFYLYKSHWNKFDPVVYIAGNGVEYRRSGANKIKVYSNEYMIELEVNGQNLGADYSRNCVFEWDVVLNDGENNIVARGQQLSDSAIIHAQSDL